MPEKPCLKCGADVGEDAHTGRPRRYCSPACRQTAAYEIQRLVRRLEVLETQYARERLMPGVTGASRSFRKEVIAGCAAQIAEAEERLRALAEANNDAG